MSDMRKCCCWRLLCLPLLAALAGCATTGSGEAVRPRELAPGVLATRLPEVPVARVPAATAMELDGLLHEDAWRMSRAYTRFGLDNGLGLLDFPTSLRFVRVGRSLWIGLDCHIPPSKDGQVVAEAIERESLELWLDNGHTRHSFHHITVDLDGAAQSPGIAPDVMAEAFALKAVASATGYTAEICIDLDRFDQLARPNARQIGFNLARACQRRWASLAGIIGQAHKPDQFWTLDLSGQATERLPDVAYRQPFEAGTDVRELARLLVQEWRDRAPARDSSGWALMENSTRRLERLLEADAADLWGLDSQLAAACWRGLKIRQETGFFDTQPAFVLDALRRRRNYEGKGPYRHTPWREQAYVSQVDGSAQPYSLYVPDDYDERRAYPLIVYLHGSGNPHYGDGVIFERYSADDNRYIKVRICARQARRYGPLAVRDVFDVIDDIQSQYNIDEDRVYLYGYSAGGFATFDIVARYPHRFAAIAILAGAGLNGNEENLVNLPTLILHGLDDPVVRYHNRTSINIANLRSVSAPVTAAAVPAIGHGVPLTGVEEWLLKWRRVSVPARVICKTDEANPQAIRNYWVSLFGIALPHRQAAVRAEVFGNRLVATTANVNDFTLDLGDLRAAGMKVAELAVDGQIVPAPESAYCRFKHSGLEWLMEEWAVAPEFDLTRYQAGGVANVYDGSPLMVIAPADLEPFARQLAGRDMTSPSYYVRLPVKRDTEVADDELARCSLILVGRPGRNAVSTQLVGEDWPLLVADGRAKLFDQEYALDRYAISVMARNPLNPSQRIWLLASNNDAAYSPNSALLRTWRYGRTRPDIMIVEVETNQVVEARVLTPQWKPSPASLERW
ncbi:MAG TPA: prolyl oligopeptidase family serine peptidase [Phycisphaerae bacterium]|nr:prolyl oligopeptidase family serine peptidase [Phycisphaerae bacterium]